MDHALYTGDLNLGAVDTQEELASVLRVVRRRADEPSLRTRGKDPPRCDPAVEDRYG